MLPVSVGAGSPGIDGSALEKLLRRVVVVAEADLVMAEQLVRAKLRFIADLDRHIHAADLWHRRSEPVLNLLLP